MRIVLLIFFLIPSHPLSGQAAPASPLVHTIHVSFDLHAGMVFGTSRFDLPGERPLHLACGPLLVTGSVLENENGPQQQVKPDTTNRLHLAPTRNKRVLLLSWQLNARATPGNSVATNGITLTGFWHPRTDDDVLFRVQAQLPPGFTGITEAEDLEYGAGMLKATFPHALPAINFAAGPYETLQRNVGATTLFTFFYPEDRQLAQRYLEKGAAFIKRFEALLGPFPYRRYAIVENRLPTGYGMPTYTLLGQAVVRLPFIVNTSLGHEILHSWFGNSVFVAENGNWCEALTTYLADQAFATDRGEGVLFRKEQLQRYRAFSSSPPITLQEFSGGHQHTARAARVVGYDKGSMVFHMLRNLIGDQHFFRGLQLLIERHRFQRAGWADVEAAFARASGQDLRWFFEQWLERDDIPRLTVNNVRLDQRDGMSRVRFTLTQKNTTPYRLLVPVAVTTPGTKETQKFTVTTTDRSTEVELLVNGLPTMLQVDPAYDLMRELQGDEAAPTWSVLLGTEGAIAVLPEESGPWQPLLKALPSTIQQLPASDLSTAQLATSSILFLGDSPLRRSVLGDATKDNGFFLQVLNNPLSPEQVMAVIDASDGQQIKQATPKLRHYSKYSRLHFIDGHIQEKTVATTDQGILVELYPTPLATPVDALLPFTALLEKIATSRVIYAGETHTDYGAHLLQLQLLQTLHSKDPNIALGMEMFPRSAQPVLNAFIEGKIEEREFVEQSGYYHVWGFDYRLYRPLLTFARRHQIPVIGLNADRKLISSVAKTGSTAGLSEEQLATIPASRDLSLPGYRRRLQSVHTMHGGTSHRIDFTGFLQAQALWDETMAASIASYLERNPQQRMLVIAGTGHVYRDNAIPPRVKRRLNVRQSVLALSTSAAPSTGPEKDVDYLVRGFAAQLPPAGKLGVLLEEEDSGLRITGFSTTSRGGETGLKKDDIIVAINAEPVKSIAALRFTLLDLSVGERVTLQVQRGAHAENIEVELSTPPLPPGHP